MIIFDYDGRSRGDTCKASISMSKALNPIIIIIIVIIIIVIINIITASLSLL